MKDPKTELSHKDFSRQGGLARAEKLNAAKRREIASKAGKASAESKKAKKIKNGKNKVKKGNGK